MYIITYVWLTVSLSLYIQYIIIKKNIGTTYSSITSQNTPATTQKCPSNCLVTIRKHLNSLHFFNAVSHLMSHVYKLHKTLKLTSRQEFVKSNNISFF